MTPGQKNSSTGEAPGGAADAARALEPTDGQLLKRFLEDRDPPAFEELLRRHGPMVLGVCRRILRDWNDADDAFQVTFLTLLRKAGSIKRRESVGAWLHGVAYRIAVKTRTKGSRCRAHQRPGVEMVSKDTVHETDWRNLQPVLDEEVNGLPEKYRSPVILCYLEGMSYAEAARHLGYSKGTIALRLSRARELLRERLSRRDVVLSLGLVLALMEEKRAMIPVPAELQLATAKAGRVWAAAQSALRSEAGSAAVTPTAAAPALTQAAIVATGWNKLKVAMVAIVAVVVLGVAAEAFTDWGPVQIWGRWGKTTTLKKGKKTLPDRLDGLTPVK
jgi:RNA polymerase sigma factor (sigma-70 family)